MPLLIDQGNDRECGPKEMETPNGSTNGEGEWNTANKELYGASKLWPRTFHEFKRSGGMGHEISLSLRVDSAKLFGERERGRAFPLVYDQSG